MKTEIELLREIAKESQNLWNKNLLPINAITLKHLLTDFSDLKAGRRASPKKSLR